MRIGASAQTGVLARLHQSRLFHRVVRVTRAQQLAGVVLRRLPLGRTLRPSGLRYRLRNLESFLLAEEIFQSEVYRDAFADREIETIVDLGCNIGLFVLYAASRSRRGRDLVGLAVDGSAEMVAETRWHLARNHLGQVHVELGVAGFPADVDETTFYVNPSNVASSAQPVLNPNVPSKGDSVAHRVAVVHVWPTWRRLYGERRIDLLKVDIEGSECELFRHEPGLLAATDRVVVEWHKWVTTFDQLAALLAAAGFALRQIVGQDDNAGVAIFDRR